MAGDHSGAARRAVVLLAAAGLAGCGGGPVDAVAPVPTTTSTVAVPTTTAPVVITLPPDPDPEPDPAAGQGAVPGATGGAPPAARRTSCLRAVHFGDSTSIGLVSPAFVKDPAARMPAQYQRVGVEAAQMEIDGARSIVETIPKQVNAHETAKRVRAEGFQGCWVVAMGTTDAANISRGSRVGHAERIDRMMAVIGPDPVLWISAHTRVGKGWWSAASMQLWNEALLDAAARYPNIRIFDWASTARPEWFTRDGIHYTSAGSAARACAIADALAVAYPAP